MAPVLLYELTAKAYCRSDSPGFSDFLGKSQPLALKKCKLILPIVEGGQYPPWEVVALEDLRVLQLPS